MKKFVFYLVVLLAVYAFADNKGYVPKKFSAFTYIRSRPVSQLFDSDNKKKGEIGLDVLALNEKEKTDFYKKLNDFCGNTEEKENSPVPENIDEISSEDELMEKLKTAQAERENLEAIINGQTEDVSSMMNESAGAVDASTPNTEAIAGQNTEKGFAEIPKATGTTAAANVSITSAEATSVFEVSESERRKLAYRVFPFQEVIRYKVDTVIVDSFSDGVCGGYCRISGKGKVEIVINHLVAHPAVPGGKELCEKYNSPLGRQLTVYHEYTHAQNSSNYFRELSRQDVILLSKYDEISANLSSLLLARQIYLEYGMMEIFRDGQNFYKEALRKGKIKPERGKISANEAKFIINALVKDWRENVERFYVDDHLRNAFLNYQESTKNLPKNELDKIVMSYFCYDVEGQKINFIDFLDKKVNLSIIETLNLYTRETALI